MGDNCQSFLWDLTMVFVAAGVGVLPCVSCHAFSVLRQALIPSISNGGEFLFFLSSKKPLLYSIKLEAKGIQLHDRHPFFNHRAFLMCHFNSESFVFPGKSRDFPKHGHRISPGTRVNPEHQDCLLQVPTCRFSFLCCAVI